VSHPKNNFLHKIAYQLSDFHAVVDKMKVFFGVCSGSLFHSEKRTVCQNQFSNYEGGGGTFLRKRRNIYRYAVQTRMKTII